MSWDFSTNLSLNVYSNVIFILIQTDFNFKVDLKLKFKFEDEVKFTF